MTRGGYLGIESGDAGSVQSRDSQSVSVPSRKMKREKSFMMNSVLWLGEQAQTQFLERNLEAHAYKRDSDEGSTNFRSVSSIPRMINLASYNSLDYIPDQRQAIRFQVIVWSIGCPDVRHSKVSMKFRVTLFWNDLHPPKKENSSNSMNMLNGDDNAATKKKKKSHFMWVMAGRSAAYKKKISESPTDMIEVPPISILNADSFEVIGQPEVQLLREDSRLMRWSCMYRANLHQDEMSVREFPHDTHNLTLKLGILSQRHPGGRWDRKKWQLALATESDTQGSIRIPYGLIVDHVSIPEFETEESGLVFGLADLKHGSFAQHSSPKDKDFFLKVSLKVKRQSAYYDKNIMPLLSILNLVSISILVAIDSDNYFQRGLMSLNIAFVEVGLRMALDNHLPHVGYQIKLQKILNRYFYSILSIVLETSVLKFLIETGEWELSSTRKIDLGWAIFLLLNQAYLTLIYTSFDNWRYHYDEMPVL